MISEHVESLIDVLERERQTCEQLIAVGRSEQSSLVKHDADGLGEGIADMQQAVREMEELHAHRRELVERMAGELRIDPSNISLPAIADRLEEPGAGRLRAQIRSLVKTGQALYSVNQQTIYLINFSLDLVERQIAAWTDALTPGSGYDADGGATRSNDPAIVEEQA